MNIHTLPVSDGTIILTEDGRVLGKVTLLRTHLGQDVWLMVPVGGTARNVTHGAGATAREFAKTVEWPLAAQPKTPARPTRRTKGTDNG